MDNCLVSHILTAAVTIHGESKTRQF